MEANDFPCPIIEALSEVRFKANCPAEAVFGIVYNTLKQDYSESSNLSILQLPEQLRKQDPNLKFKPHYQLENDKYIFRIGPDVMSISCPNIKQPYPGWNVLGSEMTKVFNAVFSTGIIDKVQRLAVRYINFFEDNVFEKVNISLKIGEQVHTESPLVLQFSEEKDNFISHLKISNDAQVVTERNSKQQVIEGSLLDIDTVLNDYSLTTIEDVSNNIGSFLEKAHAIEKELFLKLLKKEYSDNFVTQI